MLSDVGAVRAGWLNFHRLGVRCDLGSVEMGYGVGYSLVDLNGI
jgi:hypothetical protein